ncbi:MAG: SPFH/Band domain protein [Microbacterium sp.]|nr:SPFH/Band domain protein [Microbacterium sp.]
MIPSEFTEALSGIAKGFSASRGGGAGPVAGGAGGTDFLSRISKLANESLANTAAADTTMPRADATAADIVPESDLDARLAESNRSVDAHLAAADDATAERVEDTPPTPGDDASGHRTSDGSGRR